MSLAQRLLSAVVAVIVAACWMVIAQPSSSYPHAVYAAGPWHVSVGGLDNTGCGSSGSPCKTITYVLTDKPDFIAGDTIYVNGVLSESVVISKSVVIAGQSPDAAVQTEGSSRVIQVASGISVTLNALTIRNGSSTNGGGVYNEGTLIASQIVVTGNQALDFGGGVFNSNTGVLTMTQSTIAMNRVISAGNGGGGIENKGALFLTDTLIEGNKGSSYGGGIDNFGGVVHLLRAVIRKNEAARGGGVFNDVAQMTANNSAFVENRSQIQGGGISNIGRLALTNVTVSGNTLPGGPGAGLDNEGSDALASLSFVSIVSNTVTNTANPETSGLRSAIGGRVEMTGTLIAYNSAKNCYASGGAFQSFNHNLSSDDECGFLDQPNDEDEIDPRLGALSFSSGTYTHAPLRGSPAIDAVDVSACPSQDQRGINRPQSSRCDIGAHEAVAVDVGATVSAMPASPLAGASLTYLVEVTNSSGKPAAGVQVINTLPSGLTFNACTPSQGTCDLTGNQVTGAFGAVTSGSKVTLTLLVTPTTVGVVTAQFHALSDDLDDTPGNDIASAAVDVQPSADLVISSTAPQQVAPGSTFTITLLVTNFGPSLAQNVSLTATLPNNTQFVSATGIDWTCSLGGDMVTCVYQPGQLAVGSAPRIEMVLIAPREQMSLSGMSRVSALSADPNLNNNAANGSTTVSKFIANLPIVVR